MDNTNINSVEKDLIQLEHDDPTIHDTFPMSQQSQMDDYPRNYCFDNNYLFSYKSHLNDHNINRGLICCFIYE